MEFLKLFWDQYIPYFSKKHAHDDFKINPTEKYIYIYGWKQHQLAKFRSSRPELFCKKSVLRNFAKSTGKHLCQSLLFNKETLAQVFPVKFTNFWEHLLLQNTSGGCFCKFRLYKTRMFLGDIHAKQIKLQINSWKLWINYKEIPTLSRQNEAFYLTKHFLLR